MQAALRALNQLVADGVIGAYAIGGAIGASFYIDALQTEDIDAFVFLKPPHAGFISLTPIYDALKAQGGIEEREYVRFGEWPVQILTDANLLIAEAIREADGIEFDGIPTRTGRSKDHLRVTMFLEQGRVDVVRLQAMLERYGLVDRLNRLKAGE
jgi:hypothetical protein